jgi:hypothetical protein
LSPGKCLRRLLFLGCSSITSQITVYVSSYYYVYAEVAEMSCLFLNFYTFLNKSHFILNCADHCRGPAATQARRNLRRNHSWYAFLLSVLRPQPCQESMPSSKIPRTMPKCLAGVKFICSRLKKRVHQIFVFSKNTMVKWRTTVDKFSRDKTHILRQRRTIRREHLICPPASAYIFCWIIAGGGEFAR